VLYIFNQPGDRLKIRKKRLGTMEIKKTILLDSSESLSKALAQLDETPAVVITKNGKYYGMVDHRSVNSGIRDSKNIKCEAVASKPPVLGPRADLLQRVEAFMVGHFKALPVVDGELNPMGITTRVELLDDMMKQKLIPPMKLGELMSKPVFTIDENETVSVARKELKENKARRLVVLRRSNPVGVVSVFDMSAWDSKPNLAGGRKDIRMAENISVGEMKLAGFLRPDITVVSDKASLPEAILKMIEKEVSTVIVVSDKEAVGVLSASDVFKSILDMAQEGMTIQISGLGQDDMSQYDHIKEKLTHVLSKFSGSFNIRNVSVHVKEGKSTYQVNVYFDTDDGHISVKEERGALRETIDEIAGEIANILRKKKELRKMKPRTTNVLGRGKT
jgi:CBS domain-containing protein/ribosome-associated translation inhibitor RaiA